MTPNPSYRPVRYGLLFLAVLVFALVAFGVALPVINLGWIGLALFAASFFF